jgi:hypothetical protein
MHKIIPLGLGLLCLGTWAWGQPQAGGPTDIPYVGSTACKTCHPAIYERWSKTRMANVVRDPRLIPKRSSRTCLNRTRW